VEERIKQLEKELKYLTEEVKKEEIANYKLLLEDQSIDIKKIAEEIYLKHGLDIRKINVKFNNIIENIIKLFETKDKKVRKNMFIDLAYIIVLLLLLKIPFDLIRDIGYEYIKILSTSRGYSTLWNVGFLLLYTITIISSGVILLKNFVNKYQK